jgi:hypothetical protein
MLPRCNPKILRVERCIEQIYFKWQRQKKQQTMFRRLARYQCWRRAAAGRDQQRVKRCMANERIQSGNSITSDSCRCAGSLSVTYSESSLYKDVCCSFHFHCLRFHLTISLWDRTTVCVPDMESVVQDCFSTVSPEWYPVLVASPSLPALWLGRVHGASAAQRTLHRQFISCQR